jgi:hypothetical protein
MVQNPRCIAIAVFLASVHVANLQAKPAILLLLSEL